MICVTTSKGQRGVLEKNGTESKKDRRGGARPGGGRPKGVPNKATLARQAEIEASGLTPLDFMLKILRDEQADKADRFEAAKAAAPYVHPRLASMAVAHDVSERLYDWLLSAD